LGKLHVIMGHDGKTAGREKSVYDHVEYCLEENVDKNSTSWDVLICKGESYYQILIKYPGE
jgi:hypothetical protein